LAGLATGHQSPASVSATRAATPTIIESGRVGAFRLGQSKLRAEHVFGPATLSKNVPAGADDLRCRAYWRSLGVMIEFTGECSFSGPSWRVTVETPGWKTREGLRIGEGVRRIGRVYRGARTTKGPGSATTVKWGLNPLGVEWDLRRARPSSTVIVATQSMRIVGFELRRADLR
jgi:hypothetical protein